MSAVSIADRASVLERVMLAFGRRAMCSRMSGHLSLTLPSGRIVEFGRASQEPGAELQLRSYKAMWALIRRASLGLCESYVEGHWDSPDPARVFDFFLANSALLDRAAGLVSIANIVDRAWHRSRSNTRRGSKRNIAAHYDLGNDFYRLWLDETMTYSSAWFGGGAHGLEAAQKTKYRLVLDALALERGQSLLEIGCGWGGLAEAALEVGANVTAITLSEEQLAYAGGRLAGRADLRLQDYRDVEGTFDRIASIEMIEAVGEAFWPHYFRALGARLKPGGVAAIQAITIDPELFPNYRRGVDFIQRHIFPGGMLPTVDVLRQQALSVDLAFEQVKTFGLDYARTLAAWRDRFEAAWPDIAALGFDERFRRKWRLYLAYCEAGFRAGTIDVGLYRFTKPEGAYALPAK